MSKSTPDVVVEKTVVQYDPRTLTIGELIEFAEIVGHELDEDKRYVKLFDAQGEPVLDADGKQKVSPRLSTRGLQAIIFLMRKRQDPTYTLEQAGAVEQQHLVVEVPGVDPQNGASDA